VKTDHQIIDPTRLSPVARGALLEELFELNQRIFHGVRRETFERYVFAPHAERVRLQVVCAGGEAVGYTSFQVHARVDLPERPLILRGVIGMLPAFRRRSLFGAFVAEQLLRVRARYPLRPIYGFAAPVHPSSYRMFAGYAPGLWPRAGARTPPEVQAVLEGLAAQFGLTEDPAHPGVCHVGWTTIQDEGETEAWASSAHAAARFYVEQNPRYREGYGLLTVVPVRLGWIAKAVARLGGKRLRGRARGARGRRPQGAAT